jgi:hypothetical protein
VDAAVMTECGANLGQAVFLSPPFHISDWPKFPAIFCFNWHVLSSQLLHLQPEPVQAVCFSKMLEQTCTGVL